MAKDMDKKLSEYEIGPWLQHVERICRHAVETQRANDKPPVFVDEVLGMREFTKTGQFDKIPEKE